MSDERYRERINRILDKLSEKRLRGIWLFLSVSTGYSGMEAEDERKD